MGSSGRFRRYKKVSLCLVLAPRGHTTNKSLARKKELREIVENSQAQVEKLREQLQEAQSKSTESTAALECAQKELERALPFEVEVKEKNLLIGKLRHEAVILNDHLTKALRHLKKGKPDDNIDK